jgi:hypothetical protein
MGNDPAIFTWLPLECEDGFEGDALTQAAVGRAEGTALPLTSALLSLENWHNNSQFGKGDF